MAPVDSGWTAATWIALISAGFTAVSLIWNAWNTCYSYRLQNRVRTAATRLSEFGNIRTPIQNAAQNVDEKRKLIAALAKSGKDDAGVRADLGPLNSDFAQGLETLEDALAAANESRFANGNDWLEGFSARRDKSLAAMDKGFNPNNSRMELNRALESAENEVREMMKSIRERIEIEIENRLT